MNIDEVRKIKAMCNHRSDDNTHDTIRYNEKTKIARCITCGCEFTPMDTDDDPKLDVKKVIDYIQTIKLLWPDMPKESAERLYSILPVLEDLDDIYAKASYHMHMDEQKTLNHLLTNINFIHAFDDMYNKSSFNTH